MCSVHSSDKKKSIKDVSLSLHHNTFNKKASGSVSKPIELDFSSFDISIEGSLSNDTSMHRWNNVTESTTGPKSHSINESFTTVIEPTTNVNEITYNTNQVYSPDCYMTCTPSRHNPKETSKDMLNYNWMTEELVEEIENRYPKPEHL